ncbi:Tetratricopeptide repeat-containing protein [Nitrosomonas communis]|uniref:Tetratricopeptide repeat-containing protein n=2 Tax=Nitrosomonas communis TaxID=44574 RepID=A0A1I4NBP0_9PROT|nr:Tetratricopeptide repeat-containing protein [Nitrosomonas communis]
MFILVIFTSHAADPALSQNKQDYYLDKIIIQRSERYLEPAIRKFRSFPHLDKAYRLMDENKYPESKIEFQKFFEIDPLDIKARMAYVIMLYRIKEYQEVIQQASLALKQIGNSVPFLLYRALAHNAIGNNEQALKDFSSIITSNDVLEEDKIFALDMSLIISLEQKAYLQSLTFLDQYPVEKKDFNYYMRYAIAREGLGEFDLAREMLDKALLHSKAKNESIKVYMALGNLYKKSKRPDLAESAYQAALAIGGEKSEILRPLAYIYYDLGRLDKAIDMINVLLKQRYNNNDQELLANLFFANKNYLSSARAYETLLLNQTQESDLYRTYRLIGHAYSNAKQYDMAAKAFQHAAEIKQSDEVMQSLVNTLENKGDVGKAIKVYREWLNKEKSAEGYIRLSNLYSSSGDIDKALQSLVLALQSGASKEQQKTVYRTQGELLYQQKKYAEAKVAFQKAAKIDLADTGLAAKIDSADLELLNSSAMTSLKTGHLEEASDTLKKSLKIKESVHTLFMLAEVEKSLGNWEKSAEIYRHLIQLNDLNSKQKSDVLTNLGLLYLDRGQEQPALDYLRAAASMDEQNWVSNRILGNAYARFDRWDEALVQYRSALSKQNNLENLLNFAQANGKLNKNDIATDYFQRAMKQADKDGVNSEDKKTVLDTFGYFLANQKEYEQAAEKWRQSLRIKDDPVIRMRLAMLLGTEFDDDQSLSELETIDSNSLSKELNAERYDFIAQQYAKRKQFSNAISAQIKALDFIETAERHYMLGNYFQSNKQNKEALEQFKLAVDKSPDNTFFVTALGYAYLNNDQPDQSMQMFENVVEKDPKNFGLHKELAYLSLRNSDNEASKYWFKQAIDVKTEQLGGSQVDVVNRDNELANLRREVRELEDNFNFTVYSGYRQNNNTVNPTGAAGTLGGVIPSQGGVELNYRPPVIGLRDGRTFTLFSRLLWSMEPDSFKVDSETFQSTVGIRYKPFITHNFNISAEKLIKIGDSSQNNWLIRGMYGWTNGFDINFGKQYWNYTTLFADLGYFVESPSILSFFGEARQGISYNLWNNIVLTPHAVIDGRIQTKDQSNVSYLEAGGGLSLKYYFNQTRYSAPKSYIEFLFQYKAGIVNIESGFNAMGIFRY